MDKLECKNDCCFHWGEYFFCKCRRCDRKGSPAFVNECRANKKYKDKVNKQVRKIVDSVVSHMENEINE